MSNYSFMKLCESVLFHFYCLLSFINWIQVKSVFLFWSRTETEWDHKLCFSISSGVFHLFFSIMSVSHRHSHPNPQPQPQAQALPQPPQLLLSQPDLVLQLPLLHQQGGLHLHKVAGYGKKTEKNTFNQCAALHHESKSHYLLYLYYYSEFKQAAVAALII